MNLNHIHRHTAAFVCMLTLAAGFVDQAFAKKPTNVILILADDVGFEGLGCFGGRSYQTPRLDDLASQGMKAMHCYSMAVCHPTRVCLLTGKYPFRTKNPKWGSFPKDHESTTIASVLKHAGYRTAVSGKWQLSLLSKDLDQPRRMGFEQYCLFGWHEGPRYHSPMIFENGKQRDGLEKGYGPDEYRKFIEEFISQDDDRPFFVFYSMALCHDVTDDLDAPVPHGPDGRYLNYSEMIADMDKQVGQLMQFIQSSEHADNTLVIFTTDNGTPSRYIARAEGEKLIRLPIESNLNGEMRLGGKGKLTDAGTRAPTIFWMPEVVEAGTETDQLIDFADWYATLLDVGNARLPRGYQIDGISCADAILGDSSERTVAFAEHGKRYFLRDQRWKLYNNGDLYDVQAAPDESMPFGLKTDSRASSLARQRLSDQMRKMGLPQIIR